jgi:hypothetical protein
MGVRFMLGITIIETAVKRVCSWCRIVIDAGLTDDVGQYAGFVTHSICPACIARIDAQIAAVKDVDVVFSCPNCPAVASPYKVTVHGTHRMIYVRCAGCDLTWIEEALIAPAHGP